MHLPLCIPTQLIRRLPWRVVNPTNHIRIISPIKNALERILKMGSTVESTIDIWGKVDQNTYDALGLTELCRFLNLF